MEGRMMALFAMTTFMATMMGVRAADYTVGGSQGWTLSVSYANWTSGKTFKVGDTLEFKYARSAHNVLEVSKPSYDSCSAANPMKTYTSGSDKITLSSAGPKYFICGFPGHCSGGMKVSMNVMASSPSSNSTKSPSPSPAKSPSSNSTKSPSPSPAKSPPVASAPAPATPASTSASPPGSSGTTTTPTSASAPGGVGASPPNSDNSAAASSLSPAILSFLGALVICFF